MEPKVISALLAALLASLRLGPTLAFAPPFTLIRIPAAARVILTMGLAVCVPELTSTSPQLAISPGLIPLAASELMMGISMALALQLAFALIAMAGRALDIQAGFGLAFLIDPTTRAQTPLIGAVFTYAAAAVFFATSGPGDLITTFAASFQQVPLGAAAAPTSTGPLIGYMASLTVFALGLVGIATTVLFLIDLTVAIMSRTLPQMNVLVLGFQLKAITTLVLLPLTLGLTGAGIARILRLASETMLRLG